jgi:hypothetical protein
MKHRFSSRHASTMNVVRPQESAPGTQPQLQPALVRLSAIIFQKLHRLSR